MTKTTTATKYIIECWGNGKATPTHLTENGRRVELDTKAAAQTEAKRMNDLYFMLAYYQVATVTVDVKGGK